MEQVFLMPLVAVPLPVGKKSCSVLCSVLLQQRHRGKKGVRGRHREVTGRHEACSRKNRKCGRNTQRV